MDDEVHTNVASKVFRRISRTLRRANVAAVIRNTLLLRLIVLAVYNRFVKDSETVNRKKERNAEIIKITTNALKIFVSVR